MNNPGAHSGSFGVDTGEIGNFFVVSQNIGTVVGQSYTVSFWLQNNSVSPPNEFIASFNGVQFTHLVNAAVFNYTLFNFSGVATGTSSQLQFSFRHDPAFWQFDDVVVTGAPTTVPEPATMLSLGTGLAGVGVLVRKRRKAR